MRTPMMTGCLLAAACLWSGAAVAQPDPFAAWEASQRGAPALPGAPAVGPVSPLTAGTWTGGFGGSFAFTSAKNDLPEGGSASNATLFTRMAPEVGFFVARGLEVAFAPGIVVQRLDRGDDGDTTDVAWLLEAKVRYHLPVGQRLSLIGGLGMGGYFGGASRSVRITELLEDGTPQARKISESTDTAGFALSGQAGAGYFFEPRFQLRLTVDVHWLVGNERIDSGDESLSTSTTHAGLGAALMYFF